MLLAPYRLARLKLPNRVLMAPMTRTRARDGGVPVALSADSHAQRADAGLIITEGTQPSPTGQRHPHTPAAAAPRRGWRRLTSRPARLALLTILGTVLAAASITASASAAAQRYASPTGTGTACSSASPCTIRQAVENASVGDEVIVRPGTFSLTTTLETPQPITVHGIAGQPRPRLVFSGAGDGLRMNYGSTLRYVAVEKAPGVDGKALYAAGGVVDQVIATASDDYETAEIRNGTIRNSIVVASGPQAPAITTNMSKAAPNTATYRNVTAIATGSHAVPIVALATNQGTVTVHLVNVIAYRGPAAFSLAAYTDNSGATATITATHTNYQAVDADGVFGKFVDGGGNRAEEPVFVNAAASDYRQAPGAYTIDAGLDDPLTGAFDVDGDARRIGTTDIGADEFVPAPTATTGAASAVTGQSATLTGSVNARGVPTTYRFQYDTTTAYGTTTPATGAGSGTTAAAANAAVSGLRAGTTYHYRLVATNA